MYTIESVVSDLIQMKEKIKTCTIKSGMIEVILANEYYNFRTEKHILISCGIRKSNMEIEYQKDNAFLYYFFLFDERKVLYHNTRYHNILYSTNYGNAQNTSIIINKKEQYNGNVCEDITEYTLEKDFLFYKTFYYSHIGI